MCRRPSRKPKTSGPGPDRKETALNSQSTKETLTSLEKAEFLGTSIRTHMPIVSPRLAEAYSGVVTPPGQGEGPNATEWDQIQGSNVGLVEKEANRVREASNTHRNNKVKVFEIRRRRNRAAGTMSRIYRSQRVTIQGAYEDPILELVGLEAQPSRALTPLREQCVDVALRYRDPSLADKLGATRNGVSPPDREQLAEEMESAVGDYDQASKDLTEMIKVRDESYIAKVDALARLNRVYANVARVQEGYYRIAGLDELADRIRITIPKRSSRPEEEPPVTGEPLSTHEPVSSS